MHARLRPQGVLGKEETLVQGRFGRQARLERECEWRVVSSVTTRAISTEPRRTTCPTIGIGMFGSRRSRESIPSTVHRRLGRVQLTSLQCGQDAHDDSQRL